MYLLTEVSSNQISLESMPAPDQAGKLKCDGKGHAVFKCAVVGFGCCEVDVKLNDKSRQCTSAENGTCRVDFSEDECHSGATLSATPTTCVASGTPITIKLVHEGKSTFCVLRKWSLHLIFNI